jgi:hypothetical protein
MRLKSWESPRTGPQRNSKSRQASARLKQIKKRNQRLRNKLKANSQTDSSPRPGNTSRGIFLFTTLVNPETVSYCEYL